jgi:hypothetical protein
MHPVNLFVLPLSGPGNARKNMHLMAETLKSRRELRNMHRDPANGD